MNFQVDDLIISCAGRLVTVKKVDGDRFYFRALFYDPELLDEGWTDYDPAKWSIYANDHTALDMLDAYLRCSGAR